MNNTLLFSAAALCLCTGLFAQRSETYSETFIVDKNAVLEINTSHADIEFETWNKNQVQIVATVSLENASDGEADRFFGEGPIKIMGNSKKIEISTTMGNPWGMPLVNGDFDIDLDLDFVEPFLEVIEIPDLPALAVFPEMPPLPPLPPMGSKGFDYSRYKEEGETYLEEWAEEFTSGFDEEYQEKMEEWGKRMEKRAQQWEERNADRLQKLEKRTEKRAAEMEKRAGEFAKRREEFAKKREDRMRAHKERRDDFLEKRKTKQQQKSIFISRDDDEPSIFYFNSNGEGKKYKVKKTIKIKMPKSVKLKMNVRHGEVKLAENVVDINANLRYASLFAPSITGMATEIEAAYSPLVIDNWYAGNLDTKYSDQVRLAQVKDIRLNATSSNIFIDAILNDVHIESNLGKTHINTVSPDFKQLYVSVKNGELLATLPKTDCDVFIVDRLSDVSYPGTIQASVVKTESGYEITGCVNKKKEGNPVFDIDAQFSEVVLKE